MKKVSEWADETRKNGCIKITYINFMKPNRREKRKLRNGKKKVCRAAQDEGEKNCCADKKIACSMKKQIG